MVSIVIPLLNNLEMTKGCVESIEEYTKESYEIVFVDNGSTDGTPQFLKYNLKPNWRLIENSKNEGFPRACNQGMQLAEGEVILLLNNDTIVSPGWLTGMLECLNSAPDIGIVGPRSNNVSGAQLFTDGMYNDTQTFLNFCESYVKSFKGLYLPRFRIVGFCFMFKRKLIDEIGYFDERFTPGNFEDDDYCLRAMEAGYRNMIACDVFIHHHGSQSHDPKTFKALLDTNQVKFDEKWAKTPKTISAVLIVKNEAAHIIPCIESIYDVVDEVIVVDTGSVDITKVLAESCGPKVKTYDFEWIEDFSVARNFATSKATCAWILSVDADEVITGLREFKERLLYPFTAYRINTRNYTDNVRTSGWTPNVGDYTEEMDAGWFPSEKVRIWWNHPKIEWEYPVHEVVENSIYFLGYRIITDYAVQVHHYGRLKDDYEYGHGVKYYDLLHKQFKSGRNDLRSLEQLACQAQGLGKYEEAIDFWNELLKVEPDNTTAFLNMGHSYAQLGNLQEALVWSHKAWKANPTKESAMNVAICEHLSGGDENLAAKICEDLIEKYPYYPLPVGLLGAIQKIRSNQIYTGGA